MTTRIVILVDGGNVQGVWADGPVDVVMYDKDNIEEGDSPPDEEWARACVEEQIPPSGFGLVY